MNGDERSGWTPRMVFWNTVGTVLGAILGAVALVLSIFALLESV